MIRFGCRWRATLRNSPQPQGHSGASTVRFARQSAHCSGVHSANPFGTFARPPLRPIAAACGFLRFRFIANNRRTSGTGDLSVCIRFRVSLLSPWFNTSISVYVGAREIDTKTRTIFSLFSTTSRNHLRNETKTSKNVVRTGVRSSRYAHEPLPRGSRGRARSPDARFKRRGGSRQHVKSWPKLTREPPGPTARRQP